MPWTELLDRNRRWAAECEDREPGYFTRIASEHKPHAMFIGCSDARVPANLVTDSELGEIFVHRNIANQVSADASLAAGLQYAVEVLGVQDIIVCGHLGCGGVGASLSHDEAPAHVEGWISALRLLARVHRDELEALDPASRCDRLVQLNVLEQVATLKRHPSVRAAWTSGRNLWIHGWVYDTSAGLLKSIVSLDGTNAGVSPDRIERSTGEDAQAK